MPTATDTRPQGATNQGAKGDRFQKAIRGLPQNPSSVAPTRSYAQRMEALARANDIRTRRAQLKQDLKRGRQPIDELLLEPPKFLETAKIFDLLLAVPKYGRVKVNKILTQCKISPSKTIGGLSERQRRELAAFMRRRG